MSKSMRAILAAPLCVAVAFAETTYVDVTESDKLTVQTADVVLRPATEDAGTDPAELEAPAFWFDAGETDGWTITAEGRVEAIPSKVGARQLVKGGPAGWAGWENGTPSAPVYVAADPVTGLPCVDFGAMGSGRAMSFDGGSLAQIGTVFMVRDTSAGGGWIFTGTTDAVNTWKRGNNLASSDVSDPRFSLAYAPADHVNEAHELVRTALMRQDGYPFVATSIGWAGRWETFSFNPKEASLTASGLGINNLAGQYISGSGGFKIAELIVYNRVLTVDEIAGVERFLARKWLGRIQPVKGADARVNLLYANQSDGGGLTVGVEVGADKEFLVKGIRAGHDGTVNGNARIVKTGEGSLRLGDFSRYNGTVELNGGNLGLDYAEAPTYPSNIAARAVFHFDISRAETRDTYEENGTNFVRSVLDADGRIRPGKTTVEKIVAKGLVNGSYASWGDYMADRRVYLTKDWTTPTGLPTLDFGPAKNWTKFYDSVGCTFENGQPYQLTTVIALVGSQRGGGWIMNYAFQRAVQTPSYSHGLLATTFSDAASKRLCNDPELMPKDGCVYMDGKKVADPLKTGYPDGSDFHVIAIQLPGGYAPNQIGYYAEHVGGGLILGEMLAWTSPLNEKEILETSEYLAQKWLGRSIGDLVKDETLPREDGVADVQKLTVDAASSITVSGESARIGTLTVNAPLVKKGEGTLFVENLVNPDNQPVVFEGGDIRTVARPEPEASGIAAAPSLHLDMTDTSGWTFATYAEKTVVNVAPLKGTAGVVLKTNGSTATAPWVDAEMALDAQPGVAVLNFGTYGNASADAGYAGAKCLTFDRNLESVRSVFQVWRLPQDSGAQFLGSSSAPANTDGGTGTHLNAYRYDFHRGYGSGTSVCERGPILSGWDANSGNAAQAARGGVILQNGVKLANTWQYQPTYEQWVVIESHTLAGCHASGIACDRDSMKRGGLALAELIVYERELTEREKISTRNYLMKKWLGKSDEELQPVPEPDPAQELRYEQIDVSEDNPISLGVDNPVAIERLQGAGSFTKAGSGVLTVGMASNFVGALTVAAGTLKLQSAYRGEPAMAGLDKGLRFRVAADEITSEMLEANTDGTTGVKTWPSSVGDGWKAEAQERSYVIDTKGNKLSDNIPVYEANSLNGLATVRMPKRTCFQFRDPDGNYASVTDIRSVLWVIGSQEGGGFLLGGGKLDGSSGNEKYYAWHRGSATSESAGQHKEDPLVCGSGYSPTYNYTRWRVNDGTLASATAADVLSGGWDVVSCYNTMAKPELVASASGFAFDGRIFAGENYSSRAGNQRLAEVLIYTNKLTEAEIRATETYLNLKWGLNHTLAAPEQDIDLWVAAGASAELGGYNFFRSVGGSGAVTGDFGAATFVADAAETGLAVAGKVTIPENPVVELRNVPDAFGRKLEIGIVDASNGLEGAENLENATVRGASDEYRVRFRVKDGRLYARLSSGGMLLIVR